MTRIHPLGTLSLDDDYSIAARALRARRNADHLEPQRVAQLHVYGVPITHRDAILLAADLRATGASAAVSAADVIAIGVAGARYAVGFNSNERDAILSVLQEPPRGLAELRTALAHAVGLRPTLSEKRTRVASGLKGARGPARPRRSPRYTFPARLRMGANSAPPCPRVRARNPGSITP